MIISGDTAGWITPCGCTSNQSGGLPRRGTFANRCRKVGAVVLADAGGAPGGTSLYDRLKFEAILEGERRMHCDAHNLGGPEAALGAGTLREIQARLKVPFVSSNLRDGRGNLIAPPLIRVKAAGSRIAFVGVVSPGLVRGELTADEPRGAVLRALAGESFDALVVLAYLPESELRQLAAGLPEADVVVGGPTGQAIAPARAGPVWVAAATNKGKFLVSFAKAPGAAWSGQVVEMSSSFDDDPEQTRNVAQFRAALAARDLPADQTGFAHALGPDLPSRDVVAGTESCRDCHPREWRAWGASKHAHGWETLHVRQAHVDPLCQTCHTTGYGLPGGFASVTRTPERTSVGCESCHGPSRTHVLQPATHTPFTARGQCLSCHDSENSPQFAFDAYWERIKHGERESRKEARP